MRAYCCSQCGFVYDPEQENATCEYPGEPDEVFYQQEADPELPEAQVSFQALSESWCCPQCGAPKRNFRQKECRCQKSPVR